MDIYPRLDKVYIDEGSLGAHNFNTFEFERWFSVYHYEFVEQIPRNISEIEIADLIANNRWEKSKFNLAEKDKEIVLNYSPEPPREFILITMAGDEFYLVPDTLMSDFMEGNQ